MLGSAGRRRCCCDASTRSIIRARGPATGSWCTTQQRAVQYTYEASLMAVEDCTAAQLEGHGTHVPWLHAEQANSAMMRQLSTGDAPSAHSAAIISRCPPGWQRAASCKCATSADQLLLVTVRWRRRRRPAGQLEQSLVGRVTQRKHMCKRQQHGNIA